MSSDTTAVKPPLKFKGIEISGDKLNARSAGESTMAKRAPFEKGKSAENLKLRLASAVTAKIAASKEGRSEGRTSTTNNRGIGYLLQRRQQQNDSKSLNTKSISFQKPIPSDSEEAGTRKDGDSDLKPASQERVRTPSQRMLLSALMSSRLASGTPEARQNNQQVRTDRQNTPLAKTQTARQDKQALTTYEAKQNAQPARTLESRQNTLLSRTQEATQQNTEPTSKQGNRATQSARFVPTKIPTYKTQTTTDETKAEGTNVVKKLPPKTAPKPAGNNARNFSRLQENKINKPSDFSSSENEPRTNPNLPLNTNRKESVITNVDANEPKQFSDKKSVFEKAIEKKQQEIMRNENLRNPKTKNGNSGNSNVGNGNSKNGINSWNSKIRIDNSRNTKLGNKNSENSSTGNGNSKIGINSWNSKVGIDNSSTTRIDNGDSENSIVGAENSRKLSSKPTVAPKVAPKPNRLGKRVSSNSNLIIPGKQDDKFQESVLEKLETDVGSCKIAAFKTMEDFSMLRMRIHRLQSSVEELKKEREKRAQ